MDFSWPPVRAGRSNEESRGIENVGNICYQNSVMQTLLHQPPFLRWISTHNTTAFLCPIVDCVKCYVRQLVAEYWDAEDPMYAVTYHRNDTRDINIETCNSGFFTKGAQEDAFLFYTWLLDTLFEVPHPL
jgi:uncharacterized UBP type Zn finger protein